MFLPPIYFPPIDVRKMIVNLLPTTLKIHITIIMMEVIITNLEIILWTLIHLHRLLLITMTSSHYDSCATDTNTPQSFF